MYRTMLSVNHIQMEYTLCHTIILFFFSFISKSFPVYTFFCCFSRENVNFSRSFLLKNSKKKMERIARAVELLAIWKWIKSLNWFMNPVPLNGKKIEKLFKLN